MSYVYIDFEFRNVLHPNVDVISMACEIEGETYSFWCYQDEEAKDKLREFLLKYKSHVFCSYSVEAEARSFTSLGLNPFDFQWVDLMLDFRMMLNHDHDYAYGRQLVNKEEMTTYPPPPFGIEDTGESHARPEYNLGACVYKLLGKRIDTEEKDRVRDIIINKETFDGQERSDILRYNLSDIEYLSGIRHAMGTFHQRKGNKDWRSQAIERAKYACLTAVRSDMGYHFAKTETRNFSNSVKSILNHCIRDINEQFPDNKFFLWRKPTESFVRKEAHLREWIESSKYAVQWPKTATGRYSLSEEAFSKVFDYRHEFPRNNVGAQILRHLRLKKSLNGFTTTNNVKVGSISKKKTFWDYVGPDGRCRPFMNIYGSQSGRSQPSATGYLLLKSAWMRVLLTPPSGKAILSLDYSGQEFLLAGLLSHDGQMISAYKEKDVYLHIAKLLGLAPKDSTKDSHPLVRATVKTAMLGILYGMGSAGLSRSLSGKLGKDISQEEAQGYIDGILELFADFWEWRYNIVQEYKEKGFLATPDHWYMYGDNQNDRSVANFPLQGLGASIMREADLRSHERGLKVPMTLHDALYAEVDVHTPHREIELLILSMKEGFKKFFPYADVKIDGKMWSPEIDDEYLLDFNGTKIDICNQYIDERAINEYEFFKPYLKGEVL